jgi:leucyl aminopeptidase
VLGAIVCKSAPLTDVTVLGPDRAALDAGVARGRAIGEGHSLARRLGMLPGNVCTPDYLADTARDIAKRHGMQVTVLGRAEMEKEGMGSFLSVAQGTPQEPRLIVLEYRNGGAKAPVALVGKGLCFDSGGISIKPAQGMEFMKFDMCGAAGVLGAMEAIGQLKLPVNVVGLVGSTTNMPSGTAVKPGDVVRASNGKFIEIINTDAEGRLVLADALWYARREGATHVVDLATLTGAMVLALGDIYSGWLEAANVDVAEEMTNLTFANRGYQLNVTTYQTIQEMLRKAGELA